ncbi:MAG TPA: hypothetical protein VNB24_05185 [Acidimicrobiales bacterium]|nr:hypothetical protein [Acidimicrobiales bacterium]
MTRIVIDPMEIAALAALCRNTSYDVAGIASEARFRTDGLRATMINAGRGAAAEALCTLAEDTCAALLGVAAQLDDDALLLNAIGQRAEDADAIAEAFGGGEHALLSQLREEPSGGTP